MNNPVKTDELENYLENAKTWETNRVQELEKSKRIAWIIATVAGIFTFMALGSLFMLMPLKTITPFVVRVDNNTGIVDLVTALKEGDTTYDESINKYFTQWYVRYREGYSKDIRNDYYKAVGLMSSSSETKKYYEYFNKSNPTSPLNLYGDNASVKIKIKGTSFIKPDVALVRYIKEVWHGSDKPQVTHWAATVSFKYSGAPMKEDDRGINPLGYQALDYRNDPETETSPTGFIPKQPLRQLPPITQPTNVFPTIPMVPEYPKQPVAQKPGE